MVCPCISACMLMICASNINVSVEWVLGLCYLAVVFFLKCPAYLLFQQTFQAARNHGTKNCVMHELFSKLTSSYFLTGIFRHHYDMFCSGAQVALYIVLFAGKTVRKQNVQDVIRSGHFLLQRGWSVGITFVQSVSGVKTRKASAGRHTVSKRSLMNTALTSKRLKRMCLT